MTPTILAYYDPTKETSLHVDASRLKGMSFVTLFPIGTHTATECRVLCLNRNRVTAPGVLCRQDHVS